MTSVRRKDKSKVAWAKELDDLIHGICGGFLFGIPLLYTMEVWWIGSSVTPATMLGAIAITFATVFLLNRTEGFRKTRRLARPYETLNDTVDAIAIGILCSTIILVLLRELTPDVALKEAVGKIVYESIPFTLGVAVTNQLLDDSQNPAAAPRAASASPQFSQNPSAYPINATLSDLGATLIGAIFIAFNIAPTDEVPMLSAAISAPWLMAIVLVSLLISYGIVFEAGFSNQQRRRQEPGIFQRPLSETIASYLVSLMASALMLWFFHQVNLDDPWTLWIDHTVVLGLPAAIGGAAGRLAV